MSAASTSGTPPIPPGTPRPCSAGSSPRAGRWPSATAPWTRTSTTGASSTTCSLPDRSSEARTADGRGRQAVKRLLREPLLHFLLLGALAMKHVILSGLVSSVLAQAPFAQDA